MASAAKAFWHSRAPTAGRWRQKLVSVAVCSIRMYRACRRLIIRCDRVSRLPSVLEYNIVDQLAVGAGIRFVQRDYLYQNLGGDSWNTRYNNNFISIPLHVGYYLLHNPYHEKGLWIKPQVGVYYEYFTSMHTKGMYPMNIMEGYKGDGTYIRYNTTYDFKKNENHLRRSLFGGEAGIKIGYSFGKIDASVGYQFQYGFSHIYQDKASTSKTARRNSSVITAGIAYKL